MHEVDIALDTKNYGNMVEVARAHEAIQAIQHEEKPDQFYGATTLFLQIIYDFAVNNRSSLGEAKFNQMMDFLMGHASIVQDNMVRKARIDAAAAAKSTTPTSPAPSPTSSQRSTPSSPIAPNTAATIAQVADQQMP